MTQQPQVESGVVAERTARRTDSSSPVIESAAVTDSGEESGVISAPVIVAAAVVDDAESIPSDPQNLLRVPDHQELTLAQLEQLALENNPTLAQAQARLSAAYGNRIQVGLYPNPTLGYQGSEIGNDGRAGQQGLFIGQEFVTAGKLQLNRHAASHNIERVEQEFEAQRYGVLTAVRTGYYDVLNAQQTVVLAEKLVKIGDDAVQAVKALIEAAQASGVDLVAVRIEATNARIILSNARNRHSAAWRQLTTLIGVPQMDAVRLSGTLDSDFKDLEWESVRQQLLVASPQLAAARANVSRARVALRRAHVEPIPNISVVAGVQYDYGSQFTIAGLQAGVLLPVFNRNQGNISIKEAELTAAHREVERIERELEHRLAATLEQYSSARYEVERYKQQQLPDAKELLDLVTKGYKRGQMDFLRLLTTQRTYFQTNITYLEALRKLWTAKLAIEGLLLTDGLKAPAE